MIDKKVIKFWMIRELQYNFVDYDDCGEINCTKLAENCADIHNLYLDDNEATIPEEIFELAFEVSEKFQK